MERLRILPNAWRRIGVVVASVMVVAACQEDLAGGAACPALCPNQNVVVRDTTLDAIVLDSSIAGFPLLGTEDDLLVATRGDTLDVRAVVRFDSLATKFSKGGGDSAITTIDSAYLRIGVDTGKSKFSAPVRIDLYDVDTTAADTSTAAIRALFRPDRLIGGATIDTNALKDSVRIPLDKAKLLAKITGNQRLRLGIRATSANGVMLRLQTSDEPISPIVRYDPHPDTAVKALGIIPLSSTPRDDPLLADDLTDYHVVMRAPPTPRPAHVVTVGGVEGRRIFFRFDVPSRILDSATVLRATLLLTQNPVRSIDPNAKFTLFPQLVTAGKEVTDLTRAALLLSEAGSGFDSVVVAPADTGLRQIEIVNALRTWILSGAEQQQRAIVLRARFEGLLPQEAQFFSMEAAPSLRPRLRISYSPRTNFGVP